MPGDNLFRANDPVNFYFVEGLSPEGSAAYDGDEAVITSSRVRPNGMLYTIMFSDQSEFAVTAEELELIDDDEGDEENLGLGLE